MVFIVWRIYPPHDGSMTTSTVWTATAIAHAAFSLASLTIAVAFLRRIPLRGRAIFLLLTILTLTTFFAISAVDAALHGNSGALRYTTWTAVAFLLQILVALLSLHFYTLTARQLLRAAGESTFYITVPIWVAYYCFADLLFRWYRTGSITEILTGGSPVYSSVRPARGRDL